MKDHYYPSTVRDMQQLARLSSNWATTSENIRVEASPSCKILKAMHILTGEYGKEDVAVSGCWSEGEVGRFIPASVSLANRFNSRPVGWEEKKDSGNRTILPKLQCSDRLCSNTIVQI